MIDTPVKLFNRSDRLRMEFSGPKAAESLTGLITNDVLSLRGGDGLYACALTPKGRIIADLRVFATAEGSDAPSVYLVDTTAAAAAGFAAMIRKYVNPRVAKYSDVSERVSCLTLAGEGAAALLIQLSSTSTSVPLTEYGHGSASLAGQDVRIVCSPEIAPIPAFDVLCARDGLAQVEAALVHAGCVAQEPAEWRRLRTIAARPEWGIDMDESTLAQEANMDALSAISYNKGCYTGQETVARVHFRGHVNRTLRVVRSAEAALPAIGTALLDNDGAPVGDLRSTALTDAGTMTGIAMLRRTVADSTALTWSDSDGGAHTVTVVGAAAD
jgi:tRNA-modifying protein YgfZ